MEAYASLGGRNTLGKGDNPVKKIPLGVIGVDSELVVDELLPDENEGGSSDMRVCTGMEQQEVHLLSSQVLHLQQELRDATSKQDRRFLLLRHELLRINKNVARITVAAPTRRGGNAEQSSDEQTGTASVPGATPVVTAPTVVGLMPRPTSLHDLWK